MRSGGSDPGRAGRRIAVTGASGHVGANLCRKLLDGGDRVVALVHRSSAALDRLGVERADGDVLEPETLLSAFRGADVVVHLAARISIEGDPNGQVRAVNVEGSRNVVDACLRSGVRRLVHFSSYHAFRQAPCDEILTEDRPAVGRSGFAYDRSKARGEEAVLAGVERGLSAVILSPTAIIGPYDFGPSLMGQVLLDLYHRRLPTLVPGGSEWVDVRDVVEAALAAIDAGRPGTRYLLSSGWTSIRDLASLAEAVTGVGAPRLTSPIWLARTGVPLAKLHSRWTGQRPLYTHESLDRLVRSNRRVDCGRARRELGFDPRPLEETVRDTYAWFRSAGRIV